MKVHLDHYDKQILQILQEDGSITNSNLAKKINLSPSACLARTKSLKESGIIKKFATILDTTVLGMDIYAFTTINLSPLNKDAIDLFISIVDKMPEVLECHTLTGNATFLLKIIAKDIHDYGRFIIEQIMAIPGVNHIESNIVLATNKIEYILPVE